MHRPASDAHRPALRLLAAAFLALPLAACLGGGGGSSNPEPEPPPEVRTPESIRLNLAGRYATGQYLVSAAEIPAYDPASKRAFVVNAQSGKVDVLDMSTPSAPRLIDSLDASAVAPQAVVNSVAVKDGIVALAIEAETKTDPGHAAFYRADTLVLLSHVQVGALPDMLTFTPDGRTVLVANEGEPSNDYGTDPEGSISIIDVSDVAKPSVRTAGFAAWNGREAELRAAGVRIYGPGANAARDLEPEYIAVSPDGATAWASLQENNALAKIDIAAATVTHILPLGYKDHGLEENALDPSDEPAALDIAPRPGVLGMYQPDAIAAYQAADGETYLVLANEGDARAWGEDDPAYWDGDAARGFVEEFRVKHLVHTNGFARRRGDDLPPQLDALATGALLNPDVFGWCGARAGNPRACRDDEQLGRLKVTWTMGYRSDENGAPVMFDAAGNPDPAGDRLMYDALYAFGGRSVSIRDANGTLVWDSGAQFERHLASDDCRVGPARDIPCKTFFNANHSAGDAFDNRSDDKGPEPEGVEIGRLGDKTFAFVGLERMGGVMVYDITDPKAPSFVDYYNTRADWTTANPGDALSAAGDLGPEGLKFIPAADAPGGKPLLLLSNEVSGTTAVLEIEQTFAP